MKTVKAQFAPGYTGWVKDLGDGTCLLENDPLLGRSSPKCGDRVDLFYNPCDKFQRPWIGYRVYEPGDEPAGRHFGYAQPITEDEQIDHDTDEELAELERMRPWMAEDRLGTLLCQFRLWHADLVLELAERGLLDKLPDGVLEFKALDELDQDHKLPTREEIRARHVERRRRLKEMGCG